MTALTRLTRRAALLAAAALALFVAGCGDSSTEPAAPALFSTMVVFGASLDDVGNVCNLAPTACPAAPYFNGRVSNGPLWIELVGQRYGAPITPSRTGGTNFAFSGARTGSIAGATESVPSMVAQVEQYIQTGPTSFRDKSLFVLNAATVGNDINVALSQGVTNPSAPATIMAGAVNNVSQMIQRLYLAGARHILLINSTDIGRTPLVRAQGPIAMAAATQLSQQFNAGLAAALPTIRANAAGLTIYTVDLFGLATEVAANPATFGFTNVTTACLVGSAVCATPETFFYWDSFHPTAATGRLVSQRVLTALGAR